MESGGVVAMMEVIASDFARLQAETQASEAAAKTEFEEFMEDSKAALDIVSIDGVYK